MQTYCDAAQFMASWLMNQDGARGKDSVELFDEFKANVCELMKSGAAGNG